MNLTGIAKLLLLLLAVFSIVFGFHAKRMYKHHNWIDGKPLTSKKQAMVELVISMGAFGLAFLFMVSISFF